MNKNIKSVLIGLIIFLALSFSLAWGGKPKEVAVTASMRQLSANEVMEILQKFPEMVPEFLKNDVFDKKDTNLIEGAFLFSRVDITLLKQFFPNTQFYKGLDGKKPRHPYLMVVVDNKRYNMPYYFNQLLFDNGLEVNDKNIIELAKTFVILALGSKPVTVLGKSGSGYELISFPQITFLEGKRINKRIKGEGPYHAMVKIKIKDNIEEWYFYLSPVENGQFQGVSILEIPSDRFHHRYFPLIVPEEKTKEGK